VIGLMGKAEAAKVLNNMDDAKVAAYLSHAKSKDAAALVNAMDTDKVAGALSNMKGKSAAKMLSSLDAEGADAVMHKMDVVQVSSKRRAPCETWCC
jgi:Mg/Co/Ni transporter MgtE